MRLGSPVTRIERRAKRVRAGGVEADWCVLAAPLPALRRIEFAPALPPALAAAVAGLQYGAVSKTPIQYRRRFWREMMLWQVLICVELFVLIRLAASFKH